MPGQGWLNQLVKFSGHGVAAVFRVGMAQPRPAPHVRKAEGHEQGFP